MRAYVLFLVFALVMGAVIYKVVAIQLTDSEELENMMAGRKVRYRDIPAVRGNIYAVDGALLATSVPIYELRFDPNAEAITDEVFADNIEALADSLNGLWPDKTSFQWRQELTRARNEGARYHLIKRKANYNELKKARQFPIFNKGKYKGGFIYIQQNVRQKPFRILAARTIGYDRPKDGLFVGLEGAYSKELSGTSGSMLMRKISGGSWMPIDNEDNLEPEDGYDLHTTIDVNIQDVAEAALLTQLQKHKAANGSVVLMEVNTGEIRAIANLKRNEKTGRYYEGYNYAVGMASEPGSTIKLASYLALLEDGYIDLDQKVETGNGVYQFYDTKLYDSKKGGYGTITVKEAFAKSSNIGVAKLVEQYYKEKPQDFIDHLKKIGLDQPLGLEISGEGKPFIKNADDESWSGISLPWISYGYETKLTPLQILTFYNAVANDGVMVKPMFVKSIEGHGKVVKDFEPVVLNEKIASEETIQKLKLMLEAVVEEGTATNLRGGHYTIAGKTGTAQIASKKNGYDKVNYQASFCGYFPADKPMYSIMVVVNAPSKNVYYGNLVAGPIFKEISDKVYATSINVHQELENIQVASRTKIPVSKNGLAEDLSLVMEDIGVKVSSNEDDHLVATHTGMDSVDFSRITIYEGRVPDVRGMGVEDAVQVLGNLGMQVRIEGRGVVKQQSIAPGSKISKGQFIKLTLV